MGVADPLRMSLPAAGTADADARAAYEGESLTLCWQAAETGCWLAIPIVLAFAILDWATMPERLPVLMSVRLACILSLAAILWLLGTAVGRRHPRMLLALTAAIVGLEVDVVTLFTGGGGSPRYAGLILLQLAAALLIPWSAVWTLAASVLLIATYAGLTVACGRIMDADRFTTHLFLLAGGAAVATASTAFRERLRWREFSARRALGEALRHKSEFMAKMSHELRTPLHVMIGYTDILLEDVLADADGEARGVLERIRSQSLFLHGMISDLLDYAKIEAGTMELHRAPLDVREVVRHVAQSFGLLTARKGLRLDVVCPSSLPEIVSDRQRLEQILTNLMSNAVKFTGEGGVAIEARLVGTEDGADLAGLTFLDGRGHGRGAAEPAIAVIVRDTGIGIHEGDLARLALDFEQAGGMALGEGGTGLGLNISKKLARLLGGRIGVRSRQREGSTFAVFLPLGPHAWRAAA